MTIDTDQIIDWVKLHRPVAVATATGFLAWFAAMRWQAAIDHGQTALMIFYFCVSAASGVASIGLIIAYLNRLGLFE